MNLIGLSPVLAILLGIEWHRPASRLPWYLLAGGSALFWLGDLYTYSYPHLLGAEVPFPSPGDALYVAMYPVMMAGLLLLLRRRSAGTDRNNLVDGLILTVGLSLPSWIALMAPYLHLDDLSLLGKIVSVAYPIGDVILIGAVVRLALDSGRREPAFYLLTASIGLLLVTDFAYGLLTLHGLYDHQLWLDAGWIGSYLLWGAAGLHPSMARLDQPAPGREVALGHFRLVLLTCASLVAPTIGIVHDLSVGDLDYTAVRAASILLFGLVIVRMAGLVRQQDRSLERERRLSAAGAELVGATGRDEIDRVAVEAAEALAADGAAVALCRGGGRRPAALRPRPELGHAGRRRRDRAAAARRVVRGGLGGHPRRPRGARGRAAGHAHARERRGAGAAPRRARGAARRRARGVLARRARGGPRAGHPGRAGARQRGPQRGGAPAARRGALRLARAPRLGSHHRPAARHVGQLPEPVDRTRPGLRRRRSRGRALRPARGRGRSRAARAVRGHDRRGRADPAARVRADRARRRRAPVRDPVHGPDRRRACRRDPAQRARRQRAQGVRGRARTPGVPRPRHRAREPRDVRRAGAAGDRPQPARRPVAGGDLPRPRRLQDRQRLARPRGGRRGARRVRAPPGRQRARSRRRRPVRRRRVRRAARGRRREPGRRRRGATDPRAARAPDAGRPARGDAERQHRHLGLRAGRRAQRRRAHPRRRRRDVHRQATGQERIPALRAGDARGRRRTPGAAQRPPAGARDRPVRAALPAAHPPLRRFRLRGGGAAAVAPSREGHHLAARLHPDRRGDRADHPDRALGPAGGLPPRTAAGAPGRRGAAHEREPLARSRSSTPTSSPTSATRSRRPASRPRGSRSRSPSRC